MREIVTERELFEWLGDANRDPAAVLDLDLRDINDLEAGRFDDSLFLSCNLTPAQAGYLTMVGGTVVSDDDDGLYSVYRTRLYSPDELYAGFRPDRPDSYLNTLDAMVYQHYVDTGRQFPTALSESLRRRLHDFSIGERQRDMVVNAKPVAVMGGHGVARAEPLYATVAAMTRELARNGFLVLSGGGPGVMEASHLGVWFAGRDDDELDLGLQILAPRPAGAPPGKEYADVDWLARAFRVRERFPDTPDPFASLGIPTWAYGHEPPAPFATYLAKYFDNSLREDSLLAAATNGVIFTPGSAGTIQEIFQDGAQNHYETFGPPSPMVLFGRDYWTNTHPVWPVLTSLSAGRDYADLLLLTDSPAEAIEFVTRHRRGNS